MKKKPPIIKAFCNRCNNQTNHKVLKEHQVDDFGELLENGVNIKHFISSIKFQIIECSGCECVTFREEEYFPNLLESDSSGKLIISTDKFIETYYPERLRDLHIEKKITGVPYIIRKAYQEVIDCYNAGSYILASAGLRAVVESICSYFKMNSGNLRSRIDNLSRNGLISNELSEALKIHKFLGDKALHLLDIPQKDEINEAILLLELTMEMIFDVPTRHKNLKEKVTLRVANK